MQPYQMRSSPQPTNIQVVQSNDKNYQRNSDITHITPLYDVAVDDGIDEEDDEAVELGLGCGPQILDVDFSNQITDSNQEKSNLGPSRLGTQPNCESRLSNKDVEPVMDYKPQR